MDVAFIKTFDTTVGYGLTSVKKQIFLNLARITSAKTGKNHWIYKEYNEIDTNACIYIESLLNESCKFGESKILPKCNRTGNEYLTIILIVILNKLKTLWRLLA